MLPVPTSIKAKPNLGESACAPCEALVCLGGGPGEERREIHLAKPFEELSNEENQAQNEEKVDINEA